MSKKLSRPLVALLVVCVASCSAAIKSQPDIRSHRVVLMSGSAKPDTRTVSLSDIRKGIHAVRGKVAFCGKRYAKAKWLVKVAVVAPAGPVAKAKILQTPDPALGTCVRGAVLQSRYPASDEGVSFTYPFIF